MWIVCGMFMLVGVEKNYGLEEWHVGPRQENVVNAGLVGYRLNTLGKSINNTNLSPFTQASSDPDIRQCSWDSDWYHVCWEKYWIVKSVSILSGSGTVLYKCYSLLNGQFIENSILIYRSHVINRKKNYDKAFWIFLQKIKKGIFSKTYFYLDNNIYDDMTSPW